MVTRPEEPRATDNGGGVKERIQALLFLSFLLVTVGALIWGIYSFVHAVISADAKRESEIWAAVTEKESIHGYLNYLEGIADDGGAFEPNSAHISQAETHVINSLRRDWNGTVVVSQAFSDATDLQLPFIRDVARTIIELRITNFHLGISVSGEALKASYENVGYLYTGAAMTGLTTLDRKDDSVEAYEQRFQLTKNPPKGMVIHKFENRYREPHAGLFDDHYEAWYRSFIQLIAAAYGREAILRASRSADPELREEALRVLDGIDTGSESLTSDHDVDVAE